MVSNFKLLTNLAIFFSVDDLNRDRTPLTDNERRMIFNANQYFLDVRQRQMQCQDISLCKQVAMVLGIGEATVVHMVTEQNKKKMKNSQLKKIWISKKMN